MKNTFSVLFFVKKDKQKINGSYPIFVRITIDGVASRFNSKLDVQPKLWDGKAGKAAGRSAEATRINRLLDDINASLNTIYHELQRRDNYVTAEKVKNEFLGHSENHDTILNLFQKHNDDVKQLVGISKTIATYRKYEVTRRHLAEFIQSKYNLSDISIKEITPMFITDFELYLRTTCKCGYNTTAKFMQFFKRIILIARNNGILIGDPFANYKIRLEKVDRGYLTEDEIKIILKKKMVSERLEQVRDVFIFSCFSGLAYVDVANLKEDNIRKSFSFSSVSCMKDSFSTLNTSSSRSVFSRRDIHSPAMSRQIYPAVRVAIYSTVPAGSDRGRASSHPLPKKSSKPDTPQRMILRHVIFCSFTPFVPRQLRARNSTAKSFVQRILENSPAVRWKPSNILSTTPM